jgi:hypothetical protein
MTCFASQRQPVKLGILALLLLSLAWGATASPVQAMQLSSKTQTHRVLLARKVVRVAVVFPGHIKPKETTYAYWTTDLIANEAGQGGPYTSVTGLCYDAQDSFAASYHMSCRMFHNGHNVYEADNKSSSHAFGIGPGNITPPSGSWEMQLTGTNFDSFGTVDANSDGSYCGSNLCSYPNWGVTDSFTI